ncbi:MAG: hypothetical protein J7M18_08000, partial [Candidatus Eremiobacteraeota bacterium]|nr:hypothetical protein [Candidatus Eremiobacteraeota bacterium]
TIDGTQAGYDIPLNSTVWNGFGLYTQSGAVYFDNIRIYQGSEPVMVDVWPGDLNNDGEVDVFDILNVGAYWEKNGYSRYPAEITWSAQPARRWPDINSTYADADGNGIINEDDITVIKENYGKSHELTLTGGEEILFLACLPLLIGLLKRK